MSRSLTYGFGCVPSEYDVRDYVLSRASAAPLPSQYQLSVLEIKNQGFAPTCTAHAVSEALEYHHYKDTNQQLNYSTEFIYGFRNIDCEDDYLGDGLPIRTALKVVNKHGDVLTSECPGNHNYKVAMKNVRANLEELLPLAEPHRITAYYKVQTIEDVKRAIFEHGPVILALKWFNDINVSKSTGYMSYSTSSQYSLHAVYVYGYDEVGLYVQNSWGTSWGYKGTFRIKYEQFSDLVVEGYGITDDLKAVRYPLQEHPSWARLLNSIIRFLISLFKK